MNAGARRSTEWLLAALVWSVAPCAWPADLTRPQAAGAIQKYLEVHGHLCLQTPPWPIDVPADAGPHAPNRQQMLALQSAGLVSSTLVDKASPPAAATGRRAIVKVNRYVLTDAARPHVREVGLLPNEMFADGAARSKSALCYGQRALDQVEKWELAPDLGGPRSAVVTYTETIRRVAPWATHPAVAAAFPALTGASQQATARQRRHGLTLTSKGWEARGLGAVPTASPS